MKTAFLLLAALSFLLSFQGLAFAQPVADATAAKKWIADLDSPKFSARERARKELLAMKEGALEPLKDALEAPSRNLEFRRRLEELLDNLRVFERDGEPVSGLRLFLAASNDTLGAGDRMTLISTLTNVGKEDLLVRIGWNGGCDFKQGTNLHCLTDQLQAPEYPKREMKRRALSMKLPAASSVSFTTVVVVRDSARKDRFDLDIGPGLANLDLPTDGIIRLRMVHIVDLDEGVSRSLALDSELGRSKRPAIPWHGTVRSNDVEVRVVTR